MTYKDDDGEITDVLSDEDLTEAIQYFQAGGDDGAGPSTSGSMFSGYSGRTSRKITLRLAITVDYDGPSLSDTASLASMDEFPSRQLDSYEHDLDSLSGFSSVQDFEDDAVTVSSRDTHIVVADQQSRPSYSSLPTLRNRQSPLSTPSVSSTDVPPSSRWDDPSPSIDPIPPGPSFGPSPQQTDNPFRDDHQFSESGIAETVSDFDNKKSNIAVLESLKLAENESSSSPLHSSERGAQWLREQNARAIRQMMGTLPEPSVSTDDDGTEDIREEVVLPVDDQSEPIHGELALQKDMRGRYYYAYTSDALSTTSHNEEPASYLETLTDSASFNEPSSAGPSRSTSLLIPRLETGPSDEVLSEELLNAIAESDLGSGSQTLVAPIKVTDCSSCGEILDSFRYVCATCGEKKAQPREVFELRAGKSAYPPTPPGSGTSVRPQPQRSPRSGMSIREFIGSGSDKIFAEKHRKGSRTPPSPQNSLSSASSGWSIIGSANKLVHEYPLTSLFSKNHNKPLPNLPPGQSPRSYPSSPTALAVSSSSLSPPLPLIEPETGYELCPRCIESVGVIHAEEALQSTSTPTPGSQNPSSPGSNYSPTMGAQWSSSTSLGTLVDPPVPPYQPAVTAARKTNRKAQIRHAYTEKVWGVGVWKDVGELKSYFYEVQYSNQSL